MCNNRFMLWLSANRSLVRLRSRCTLTFCAIVNAIKRGMMLACSCTVAGCGLAMLHVTGSGLVSVWWKTSSKKTGCVLTNSGSFQNWLLSATLYKGDSWGCSPWHIRYGLAGSANVNAYTLKSKKLVSWNNSWDHFHCILGANSGIYQPFIAFSKDDSLLCSCAFTSWWWTTCSFPWLH